MTRLLLLAEDDTAPDAREYFEKDFLALVGRTVEEFKETAHRREIDDGYAVEFFFGDLVLSASADSPWYKLHRFFFAPCDNCINFEVRRKDPPCSECKLSLGYRSYKKRS